MSRKAKKQIRITVDPELYDKFEYVCNYYGLTFEDQLLFSIGNFIHGFENEHGEIDVNKN